MMNLHEYQQLQAEMASLGKLLDQLPPSSVIARMSLESRKKEIEATLASQPVPSRGPARVKLTFRGKPVVGSHGMFAEFGTKAVSQFATAIAALGASQSGPLGTRGVLPNHDQYRLLITNTALGSFGFELEEAPKDDTPLFPESAIVETAIEQAKAIMEASLGTDDELSETLVDADLRAIAGLREFLKTMSDEDASCALEFKGKVFRFADVGQVRRSQQRLSLDNIRETSEEKIGVFQGALPKGRTFEFRVSGASEDPIIIISGKIGSEIEDAGQINHILEKPTKIKVRAKQVGSGRPRYVLLSYALTDPSDSRENVC